MGDSPFLLLPCHPGGLCPVRGRPFLCFQLCKAHTPAKWQAGLTWLLIAPQFLWGSSPNLSPPSVPLSRRDLPGSPRPSSPLNASTLSAAWGPGARHLRNTFWWCSPEVVQGGAGGWAWASSCWKCVVASPRSEPLLERQWNLPAVVLCTPHVNELSHDTWDVAATDCLEGHLHRSAPLMQGTHPPPHLPAFGKAPGGGTRAGGGGEQEQGQGGASCRIFLQSLLQLMKVPPLLHSFLSGTTSIPPRAQGLVAKGVQRSQGVRTCRVWGLLPGQWPCTHSPVCHSSPKYP